MNNNSIKVSIWPYYDNNDKSILITNHFDFLSKLPRKTFLFFYLYDKNIQIGINLKDLNELFFGNTDVLKTNNFDLDTFILHKTEEEFLNWIIKIQQKFNLLIGYFYPYDIDLNNIINFIIKVKNLKIKNLNNIFISDKILQNFNQNILDKNIIPVKIYVNPVIKKEYVNVINFKVKGEKVDYKINEYNYVENIDLNEEDNNLIFETEKVENKIELPIFDNGKKIDNILYFKNLIVENFVKYLKQFNINFDKNDVEFFIKDDKYSRLIKELEKYIENLDQFKKIVEKEYEKDLNNLEKKYKNIYIEVLNKKIPILKYIKQILYEFIILYYTGYVNYLLIVQDYINWAEKNGIVVWPGRWSAAWSLLVFLLWITKVDPMIFGLMFERFLNPARISPPDIDVDFEETYRDTVILYTMEKYGPENVFRIGTYQKFWIRSAFDAAWMYLGLDNDIRKKISDKIEDFDLSNITDDTVDEILNATDISIDKIIEKKTNENNNKDIKKIKEEIKEKIKIALKITPDLENIIWNQWIHACGVIISPKKFNSVYKIELEEKKEAIHFALDKFKKVKSYIDVIDKKYLIYWTYFSGPELEWNIWLLKFDFLWLSTLKLIKETIKKIDSNINISEFIRNIIFNKLDDKKIFENIFSKGLTTGVFQFESNGMKKFLKQLKPNNINDIVAMNALYRPGPIGFIPVYIKRKHLINFDKEDFKWLIENVYKDEYKIFKIIEFLKENKIEQDIINQYIQVNYDWLLLKYQVKFNKFLKTLDDNKIKKVIDNIKDKKIDFNFNEEDKEKFYNFLKNFYKITFLPKNIEEKLTKEQKKKIYENMLEISKETYGIFVYQEQLMNLSKKLAGFSSNEADRLRKIIGKKKLEELPKLKEKFLNGIKANNLPEEVGDYIFEKIIKPAGEYSFNKSHAVAYSIIAFITAYLKYYYYKEFITSLIDINIERWSQEKDETKKKYFKALQDIYEINESKIFDKKFELRTYNINNINTKSTFIEKENKVNIFVNIKIYKGISESAISTIENEIILKKKKKLTYYDLLFDKILNKTTFYWLITNSYLKIDDMWKILNKEIIQKIIDLKEKIKNEINIKDHLIEHFILFNILTENYDDLYKMFSKYIDKLSKFLEKQKWKFAGQSLFTDHNQIKQDLEFLHQKALKTYNYYNIIENNLKNLINWYKNYKKLIKYLILDSINKTLKKHKIDVLLEKKINILKDIFDIKDEVFIIYNVEKFNKWKDFKIKLINEKINKIVEQYIKWTKENIEFYNYLYNNIWHLLIKKDNLYLKF